MAGVPTINLHNVSIVIADPSDFVCRIAANMLRGFGANRLAALNDAPAVMRAISSDKVGILLCDTDLPPDGGLALTRKIRQFRGNDNRTMPILIMTTDLRESVVKRARDAGANMVIARPLSPSALYDRLSWIAFNTRLFVETVTYFGPDRRFKIEGYPTGVGRRKDDKAVEIGAESGPALGQGDIDDLFVSARRGEV
jgi:two-component system, chemotaxis family, chemotaxis protein CheY